MPDTVVHFLVPTGTPRDEYDSDCNRDHDDLSFGRLPGEFHSLRVVDQAIAQGRDLSADEDTLGPLDVATEEDSREEDRQ